MQKLLNECLTRITETKPENAFDFYINAHRCGVLTEANFKALSRMDTDVTRDFCFGQDRVDLTLAEDTEVISLRLREIALRLDKAGLLTKWRNEDLDVFDLDSNLFVARVERALFRFFGMKTQAVYAVGTSSDGRFWSGQRALTKPIDPGLWDTLAAGLIAAAETPATSLFRELEEEAGLTESDIVLDKETAQFCVTRVVSEGWMHEVAFVYPCTVKDDARVHNVDGEVSRFALFSQDELLEKIRMNMTPADTAVAFLKTIELKN